MSRHATKQNGVSALIRKKPYDCLYEKKSIKAEPNEYVLVPKRVIDKYNQLCNDVLEVLPDSESWRLADQMLIEMNQRDESLEVGTSKDSVCKKEI